MREAGVLTAERYSSLNIGLSTACFFGKGVTENSIRTIREAGFSVCEVFFDAPMEYDEAFYPILRDALGDMKVHSIHGMSSQFEPQLFSISARQKAAAMDVFRTTLAQGRRLGAKYYVMHGPMLNGGSVKNIAYARISPIIADIAHICKEEGLLLAWENVSWCLFNRPEFIAGIREFADHPDLYFTLDIKQAARTGADPFDFLEAMGDRCVNVHLCDYSRTESGVALGLPGRRSFDFARLFAALKSNGYAGPAMVEVYSDAYERFDELIQSARDLMRL